MSTVTVSSKGQIVLPAALRRRLHMGAGSTIEVIEDDDGVRLRVVRPAPVAGVADLAGMVKAPRCGTPRRLENFDPASLLARQGPRRP
jgi:AbrB family looped-hinge helix DNA binding protein